MKGTGRAVAVVFLVALAIGASTAWGTVNGTTHTVSGVGDLQGVACPPKGACIAVGETRPNSQNEHTGVFVPISHGKPGTAKQVSKTAILSRVACPADNMCIAVGSSFGSTQGGPLYQTWYVKIDNGKAGKVHSLGLKAVASIGCGSASSCWVFGQDFPANPTGPNSYHAKIVHLLNGKVDKVYSPSGSEEFTAGEGGGAPPVCFSAKFCLVAGSSGYQRGAIGELFSVNDGTLKVKHKVSSTSTLSGLSCSSKDTCTMLGYKQTNTGVQSEVLKLANGKLTSHATKASIYPLACSSASSCFGFGSIGGSSTKPPQSVVVPINGQGKPGSPEKIDMFAAGATCRGSHCLAAGSEGQYPKQKGAVFSFKG